MRREPFLAAAGVLPPVPDGGEPERHGGHGLASDPPRARPSVTVADPPLYLDAYPPGALATGTVALVTHGSEVFVGVEAADGEREVGAGFWLTPGGAEAVADLLRAFATRAREGDERVYP